jgi:hypothetical protein
MVNDIGTTGDVPVFHLKQYPNVNFVGSEAVKEFGINSGGSDEILLIDPGYDESSVLLDDDNDDDDNYCLPNAQVNHEFDAEAPSFPSNFIYTTDQKWTVSLLKILDKANAPDYVFGDILEWGRSASAQNYSFNPVGGLSRSKNVDSSVNSVQNGNKLLPFVRRVMVPHGPPSDVICLDFVSGGCHHPIFWLFFFWVEMRELLLCRYPLPDFSSRWKTHRHFLLCVLIRKLIPTCLQSCTLTSTSISTSIWRRYLISTSISTMIRRSYLISTSISTTIRRSYLISTSISTTIRRSYLISTAISTTIQRSYLISTSISTTIRRSYLISTFLINTSISTRIQRHYLINTSISISTCRSHLISTLLWCSSFLLITSTWRMLWPCKIFKLTLETDVTGIHHIIVIPAFAQNIMLLLSITINQSEPLCLEGVQVSSKPQLTRCGQGLECSSWKKQYTCSFGDSSTSSDDDFSTFMEE